MVRMTAAFALVVGFYFAVPVHVEAGRSEALRLLLAIALLLALTLVVVWQVRVQLVNPDRHIDGLLLALVVGVLGFALGFYVLEQRHPGEVADLQTRVDSLYFTMSTLLTVGYGDVHAAGQGARVLVLIQMVYDVVVIAGAAGLITRRMRRAASVRVEKRVGLKEEKKVVRPDQPRRTHRKPT